MQRASGISARQARAIENSFRAANRQLDGIGRSMAQSITGPLAGVGAALGVREVMRYADAWTAAKNSLAVAGVTGAKQAAVLDELFRSAQANAAPLQAMTTLYGRAAQVSTELGASQGDLLKFTDGVATALKVAGTDASQASGALLQLGQALGSAKVQAEEFNSINEGARPILQAVAAGLDAAGGSVAKLKTLVNDGKVTNREFFQAFLRGLPTIQAMAANSSQTISQAYTKINNALTKYIGETDEGLGATQRLVAGLNALADNFSKTADIALRVASVIAAALVGRAIGGMIASLGLGIAELGRFVAALRAAQGAAAIGTAFGGLAAAAGPIGMLIGTVVVGALALFSTTSTQASAGGRLFAEELRRIQQEANKTAPAVDNMNRRLEDFQRGQLQASLRAADVEIAKLRTSLQEMYDSFGLAESTYLFTPEQQRQMREAIKSFLDGKISADDLRNAVGRLSGVNPNFDSFLDSIDKILSKMREAKQAADNLRASMASTGGSGPSIADSDDASRDVYIRTQRAGADFRRELERRASLTQAQVALEDKIAEIRKRGEAAGAAYSQDQLRTMAQIELAAEKRRSEEGKTPRQKRTTDDSFNREIQAIRDRTAALVLEQEIVGKSTAEQERRRMELELEQQVLKRLQDTARQNGDANWRNVQISEEQRKKIKEVAAAYGEQAAALQRVTENQQRAQQAAEEFYSTAKQGFIDAITGAKSFQEALGNIAKKLADLMMNMAFDSLFKPAGGGGLFGWLTSAFGGFGGGGTTGTGWWEDGGYTGDGGKHQPAGTVHKGEYVFSKEATRRAGVANLEALHRSLKGYANGGLVGGTAPMPKPPRIPTALLRGSGQAGPSISLGDTYIDARGSQMTEAQMRALLAENNKRLLEAVPARMKQAQRDRDI